MTGQGTFSSPSRPTAAAPTGSRPQSNYYTAANETLASLDAVSDETDQAGIDLAPDCADRIGALYRRLTAVIETY
ncbi:MAG: hypothetical protein GVY29_04080 [Spirochaetes bacterium]|nr:hypothetical protein [Spirochaetota bacterium]